MDNSNNDVSGNVNVGILEVPQLTVNNDNTIVMDDTNTNTNTNIKNNVDTQFNYKESKEFIIFKNGLESLINNNLYILKECKSNKRLLDIKYANLTKKVNYIQISVVVLSTMSGFLQSTKEYFHTPDTTVAVCGISISTYISLILSVSKYYKFDETKESIHNLREKYGNLHNKIEFRMDVLGPYTNYKLWEHQDVIMKLQEWSVLKKAMEDEYISLIETKQTQS